jgi:hypothetical protein
MTQDYNYDARAPGSKDDQDISSAETVAHVRVEIGSKDSHKKKMTLDLEPERHDTLFLCPKQKEAEPICVLQIWHRPYAEALIEAKPEILVALIAAAEREILTRYFELAEARIVSDEVQDLRNAVTTLSLMKKGKSIASDLPESFG